MVLLVAVVVTVGRDASDTSTDTLPARDCRVERETCAGRERNACLIAVLSFQERHG